MCVASAVIFSMTSTLFPTAAVVILRAGSLSGNRGGCEVYKPVDFRCITVLPMFHCMAERGIAIVAPFASHQIPESAMTAESEGTDANTDQDQSAADESANGDATAADAAADADATETDDTAADADADGSAADLSEDAAADSDSESDAEDAGDSELEGGSEE